MTLDDVKRNCMQKGIKIGVLHLNSVQRLKNFCLEKKGTVILNCIKFCSNTSYQDSLKIYYDFKKYLSIMKALRLEIKSNMIKPNQIECQTTIDDMSFEYKTTMNELIGLYLLNCQKSGLSGEYNSEQSCEQASKIIKRNKYMNKILGK